MEAVFRPEICWIFSGGFQSISRALRQEPVRNHRKKSEKFPVGILLPRSSDFLPELARNFRPGLELAACSITNNAQKWWNLLGNVQTLSVEFSDITGELKKLEGRLICFSINHFNFFFYIDIHVNVNLGTLPY
jgi:2,3-bisphosphoglycerate-independent phosphoglycerate mutase